MNNLLNFSSLLLIFLIGLQLSPVKATSNEDYHVKLDVARLDPIHGINGSFIIAVYPSWAPSSAERFRELVNDRFYINNRFFRVVLAYIAEFGLNGDPQITGKYNTSYIPKEPFVKENKRGTISFTCDQGKKRSTAVFINYSNNPELDKLGCRPFGEVIDGMAIVDSVYPIGTHGIGDGSDTFGPNRKRIISEGNDYLEATFPELSYISDAKLVHVIYKEKDEL